MIAWSPMSHGTAYNVLMQSPKGTDQRLTVAPTTSDGTSPRSRPDPALLEKVQEILDLIRPAVQSDGGDVELVDITDQGIVQLRLHGACVGCPSSAITLKAGIERTLIDRVAGIAGVEAVS